MVVCTLNGMSRTPGTSKCNCSPTSTATSSTSAIVTARRSVATRSSLEEAPATGAARSAPLSPRRRRSRTRAPARLRRCRNRRVPRRSRSQRVLVPRSQHPRAGRASGHRDGHRSRHRPRATPARRRVEPLSLTQDDVMVSGHCDRVPHQRRIGRVGLLPSPGRSRAGAHRRGPTFVSTATPSPATRFRRTTTH